MTQALVALMPKGEAKKCVESIRQHMAKAGEHLGRVRQLLLDLHERRGWASLGYESWRACVETEFEQGQRQLYRQLEAARIERDLSTCQNETIPERTLRNLAPLDPDQRREVWEQATADGQQPTSTRIQELTASLINRMPPDVQNRILDAAADQQRRDSDAVDAAANDVEGEKSLDCKAKIYAMCEAVLRQIKRDHRHETRWKRCMKSVRKRTAVSWHEVATGLGFDVPVGMEPIAMVELQKRSGA